MFSFYPIFFSSGGGSSGGNAEITPITIRFINTTGGTVQLFYTGTVINDLVPETLEIMARTTQLENNKNVAIIVPEGSAIIVLPNMGHVGTSTFPANGLITWSCANDNGDELYTSENGVTQVTVTNYTGNGTARGRILTFTADDVVTLGYQEPMS